MYKQSHNHRDLSTRTSFPYFLKLAAGSCVKSDASHKITYHRLFLNLRVFNWQTSHIVSIVLFVDAGNIRLIIFYVCHGFLMLLYYM